MAHSFQYCKLQSVTSRKSGLANSSPSRIHFFDIRMTSLDISCVRSHVLSRKYVRNYIVWGLKWLMFTLGSFIIIKMTSWSLKWSLFSYPSIASIAQSFDLLGLLTDSALDLSFIDVGDECWRRLTLVTTLRCRWLIWVLIYGFLTFQTSST